MESSVLVYSILFASPYPTYFLSFFHKFKYNTFVSAAGKLFYMVFLRSARRIFILSSKPKCILSFVYIQCVVAQVNSHVFQWPTFELAQNYLIKKGRIYKT